MNYFEADSARKKGLANLITDRLVSGQSIGSSIGQSISERMSAAGKGFKKKFDILNIAKTLTGGSNLAPALLGKMLGRKSEDIAYFAGRKDPNKGIGTSNSNKSVQILNDMLSFMKKTSELEQVDFEISNLRNQEETERKDKQHKEVMDVFIAATEAKRKAQQVLKAKGEEPEKEEKPIGSVEPSENLPKDKKEPDKPAEESNVLGTVTTAATAAVGLATKSGMTTKVPALLKSAGQSEAVSAAMSTASKVPALLKKPASSTQVSGKNGVENSPAALSIQRETGAPASQAIKKVGQIVQNDPKPGVSSYGIFGINSGGSIQNFVKQNPQFGLTAKPASKEFDEQWAKISTDRPQEMLDAQTLWYENNISKPLKKEFNKLVPKQFSDDPRIFTYLSDRRIQYGPVMEDKALAYASTAKTPEEYLARISEFDLLHLKSAFKTALSTNPKLLQGLKNRITEREKFSLNVSGSSLSQLSGLETGETIATQSKQNADMKSSLDGGTAVGIAINNTTNNVVQEATKPAGQAQKTTNPTLERR
jgi:hypothetical protein